VDRDLKEPGRVRHDGMQGMLDAVMDPNLCTVRTVGSATGSIFGVTEAIDCMIRRDTRLLHTNDMNSGMIKHLFNDGGPRYVVHARVISIARKFGRHA
jgi:hypothetical protein